MLIDSQEIAHFYDTPLGRFVTRRTREILLRHIPSPRPKRILGVGYLQHVFRDLFPPEHCESCTLGVPKHMGVTTGTLPPPIETVIIDNENLPFADCSFDLIVVAHGLENGKNQERFLREVWRVLDHKGTIMLVVPHKMSTWCRYGKSPFSKGSAFTTTQLTHALQSCNFMPMEFEKFLFTPPVSLFRFVETYVMFDRLLGCVMPTGGLILGIAEKRLLIRPPCDKEPSFADWLKQKVIPGSRRHNYRK